MLRRVCVFSVDGMCSCFVRVSDAEAVECSRGRRYERCVATTICVELCLS